MGQHKPWLLERLGLGQGLRRWARLLRSTDGVTASQIRDIQREMAAARARLDTLSSDAETALLDRLGPPALGLADPQCDWAARPAPWHSAMRPRGHVDLASPTRLQGDVTLHHDAGRSDLSLRQERAPPGRGDARFGLVLEVYRFDGSFVSLVHDLPEDALRGLSLNHYVAVALRVEREHPGEVYLRLNVQHGPNVEQMVRQVEFHGEDGRAEFDLAYSRINEKRIEKAWLDLIFEGPEMTRIAIWDLVVLRALRADI